jgi:hypothetical protein
VGERDEILELRLYELAIPLTLMGDGVVADVTLAIDLKGERVPCSRLLLPETKWILCNVTFRVCTTVACRE